MDQASERASEDETLTTLERRIFLRMRSRLESPGSPASSCPRSEGFGPRDAGFRGNVSVKILMNSLISRHVVLDLQPLSGKKTLMFSDQMRWPAVIAGCPKYIHNDRPLSTLLL